MLAINLVSIFFASISLINIDKVKINENNLLKSIVDINIIHIFVRSIRHRKIKNKIRWTQF